jgi:hypothetical protein
MFKTLLGMLFGRRDQAAELKTVPAPAWRKAPERTWSADAGHGVSVTMTVTTGHHGFLSVVGESNYQGALRPLADRLGRDGVFVARLVPEPDNPYDTNAVAVCVDGNLAKVGYLKREVAKNYHPRLVKHGVPIACSAKLIGVGLGTIGVVLDFEGVRVALGLPRVSVDQGDMDYEAIAEYHRLNNANREMVKETRPIEQSNPTEAVSRYRMAVNALVDIQKLARSKQLVGFEPNLTDAAPIERLTLCLVRMRQPDDATAELGKFVEAFPHLSDSTLIKRCRERIERVKRP